MGTKWRIKLKREKENGKEKGFLEPLENTLFRNKPMKVNIINLDAISSLIFIFKTILCYADIELIIKKPLQISTIWMLLFITLFFFVIKLNSKFAVVWFLKVIFL